MIQSSPAAILSLCSYLIFALSYCKERCAENYIRSCRSWGLGCLPEVEGLHSGFWESWSQQQAFQLSSLNLKHILHMICSWRGKPAAAWLPWVSPAIPYSPWVCWAIPQSPITQGYMSKACWESLSCCISCGACSIPQISRLMAIHRHTTYNQ